MKTQIRIYSNMVAKVAFFFKQLKLKITKSTGRPLTISPEETIAMSLFKQSENIKTKKSIWKIFDLQCSYKTLVVNMNRLAIWAFLILKSILKWNQKHSHIVKHTDSTDIPVCLTKNGSRHRTMSAYANWAHGPKGWYYGLKMSITTDLRRNLLAVSLGSGNSNDRTTFKEMNKDMMGIFIADAGYISKDLERDFFIENKRILFAKPRANMKRIATEFQNMLYDTRMLIELNFRNLKVLHGLETSMPRSVDGYLGNYVYSLLAYVLC
jgi:Transposase DDE domain